jgi:hypothetical protein
VEVRRLPALLAGVASAALLATAMIACEPTLDQETGVVLSIDSPSLGRVETFELLTGDGERITFDTSELAFRPEFPAAHLSEHRVLGDRIVVTYRIDGERRVVTQLDDAEEGAGH